MPNTHRTNSLNPKTYWNGEPCEARKVIVTVVDEPDASGYWARQLAGERRDAVEVTYCGHTFYLDDAEFEPEPDSDYAEPLPGAPA